MRESIVYYSLSVTTCASGSAVEHLLAKEGVAGSIPVSRSQKKRRHAKACLLFFRGTSVPRSSIFSASLRSAQGRRPPDVVRRLALFSCKKQPPTQGMVASLIQLYFWRTVFLITPGACYQQALFLCSIYHTLANASIQNILTKNSVHLMPLFPSPL